MMHIIGIFRKILNFNWIMKIKLYVRYIKIVAFANVDKKFNNILR